MSFSLKKLPVLGQLPPPDPFQRTIALAMRVIIIEVLPGCFILKVFHDLIDHIECMGLEHLPELVLM